MSATATKPKRIPYMTTLAHHWLSRICIAVTLVTLVLDAGLHANTLTPYPLTICIITGDKLGEEPMVFSYDGREIKTCCTDCIDQFHTDPAGFVAKIEELAAAAQKQ